VLGEDLACPPCNIGPLSTPDYAALAAAAIHPLRDGSRQVGRVFAGQRAEGFYVDLGAIFDLGILRPFEQLHTTFGLSNTGLGQMAASVNSTDTLNVHSIAIQVPITALTRNHSRPTSVSDPAAVLGVWTTASRRKVRILGGGDEDHEWSGPWVQVSRLGNPLINEVIIPLGRKDFWNSQPPYLDSRFVSHYAHPELAGLLPVLYPGVFPKLAAYSKARVDLEAILLTGIPSGVIPNFTTSAGSVQADLLRLNVAIAPATSPSVFGVVGGDLAGFPNGRRVFDDVATIEVRAIAGATIPLVDPTFTPDGAAGVVGFNYSGPSDLTVAGTEHYLSSFPYLGLPHSGFNAHTANAVAG
jgi:hypothetical protein